MRKKSGYEAIGFNQYLTRDENINLEEQIKIDKHTEEQRIKGLELINAELAQIKKDIYEGIIGNNNITKEAKKKLLDTKRAQLEKLSDRKQDITGVHSSDISIAIIEVSQLKEDLENETEVKLKTDNSNIVPKRATYPLELYYSGDRLMVRGNVIPNPITLVSHQSKSSGLLLDPIFKACKSRPTQWQILTKHKIMTCFKYDDTELQDEIEKLLDNPSKFRKYLSNAGLKGLIRKLFIGKTGRDLRIKFRLVVTIEEWDSLSVNDQENIVKSLS